MMAGKFLSLEEAARRLGVSIDEVNRLVDRKELFPMRDGATIKFKVDEIERVAADLGVGAAADDDDLALELSAPGLGASLSSPGSGGSAGDVALDEEVDEESIFTGEGGGAVAGSQTVVRGGAPALGSGTFDDDLSLESIVGASSPSLGGGDAASPPTGSGTLAIDLSNIGGSLVGGSVAGLSSPTGLGGSLAGAVDSGLSLEGGELDVSGVDLDADVRMGAAPGSAVESFGGSLAGDAFELGADVADEESASVVIPTEETGGDSSFFGAAMDDSASASFGDPSGSAAIPMGTATDFEPPSLSPPFSVWQVVGLICCTLLLFVCGLVVFDVLTTVRGPQASPISSPLISALADTFGW